MNQVFRNEYKAASINTTSRLIFYLLTNRKLVAIIQDNQAIINQPQITLERGFIKWLVKNLLLRRTFIQSAGRK